MLMPKKHIKLSESYLGLGAYIISILEVPMTVDSCWNKLFESYIKKGKIAKSHSFDNYILTLDFLYSLKAIDINQKGEIYNVYRETKCK